MKRLFNLVLVMLLLVVGSSTFTSCHRVEPNEQGVLMQNFGKNGKSDFSLQKGKVWTVGPSRKLYTVPLWEQRNDFSEGALDLKSADNTEFTSQPRYSYEVIEARSIDVVFNNKQIGSGNDFMEEMENNILEPMMYDLIKEESRKYKTEELMADGGSLEFENRLHEVVKEAFLDRGLKLKSFSAQLEFTEAVTDKIDKRNEVNTNLTVLDQEILEQAKMNELEALRTEFNKIKSDGLTPQILQMEFIDAWRETKQPLYGYAIPQGLMIK